MRQYLTKAYVFDQTVRMYYAVVMTDRTVIESIFRAAIKRVDPDTIIQACMKVDDRAHTLSVQTEQEDLSFDLGQFDRIIAVGAGKASARMARGLEAVLGSRLEGGVIAVKPGHVETLDTIEMVEAGHPVPDEGSVVAAERILALLETADEGTLVINLVSGGGSALLTLPAEGLELSDMQGVTSSLLACGASIQEFNCVRKHLSRIKGGRLAAAAEPATLLALVLSDVIGDDLASIASGLTSPDPATYSDAQAIVDRYGIADGLPAAAREQLRAGCAGEIADTPKPGDPLFRNVHNVLIGTNAQALMAGAEVARQQGLNVVTLTSQLAGEARDAAAFFAGIASDLLRFDGDGPVPAALPACVMAGGETTVTLRGDGKGGRNQEMALAFLDLMGEVTRESGRITFASVGTDGNDGPTDAAGGWADIEAARNVVERGIDVSDSLARNDAYHALDAAGALIKTGPTNTNVCDLQILLVR